MIAELCGFLYGAFREIDRDYYPGAERRAIPLLLAPGLRVGDLLQWCHIAVKWVSSSGSYNLLDECLVAVKG